MRTRKNDTLIDRCLRGDRVAQNELYQREVHGVFHLVIRLVANRTDAEDLTQECFIRVVQRLSQFRGEASVRTTVMVPPEVMVGVKAFPPYRFLCRLTAR